MFQMMQGKPLPLGVSKTAEGVQFAIAAPEAKRCTLRLYRKADCPKGSPLLKEMSFPMLDEGTWKVGDVFCCTIVGDGVADVLTRHYEYAYEIDGEYALDPYAMELCGRSQWGKAPTGEGGRGLRCGVTLEPYPWGKDARPSLPYSEMVLYQLHVRGFTKHRSSGVKDKGTFLGIIEKISHVKEVGANALLLLPCYDFNEIMETTASGYARYRGKEGEDVKRKKKLNYWGYTDDCFYFAPKASYASDSKHPSLEFKNMVKQLHEEGIEVLMEMKFAYGTNSGFILDCLRHWVLEYHVDGFLVNQEVVPEYLIRTDPVLSGTKLLADRWSKEAGGADGRFLKPRNGKKRLADYNNGFLTDARKYVKSDEGMVHAFATRFRNNSKDVGVVNYISQVNGFTLMDMVSYDVKHNEANGEEGRDGMEMNYSWNCGIEGKSRKKAILEKRLRQMKNAAVMLVLSQGTPMILAGDEFGNSQNGNNNAYCQDNEVGWVNWDATNVGKEFFAFLKELIAFRKSHPIFHMDGELLGMDTISCGYPDISFHSTRAWYADFSNYSRVLGIMLCGRYAGRNGEKEATAKGKRKVGRPSKKKPDDYYYLIFNMHWEEHVFDLPKLPGDLQWKVGMSTGRRDEVVGGRSMKVDQRTVVLLKSATRTGK